MDGQFLYSIVFTPFTYKTQLTKKRGPAPPVRQVPAEGPLGNRGTGRRTRHGRAGTRS